MPTELQAIYDQIMQAVCSEDIFGLNEGNVEEQLTLIKQKYHRLSRVAHPDHYANNANDFEMAGEAFARLSQFYEKAQEKIKAGTYGKKLKENETQESDFVIQTRKHEYHLKTTLAQGDLCTVYGGDCVGSDDFAGQVAVKLVESSEDNFLMQNEVRVLRMFQTEPSKQSKHLPVFLDQFKTSDDRLGTVLRKIDGYDLHCIRDKYINGVPTKHVAWIFERLLSVLGFAHSKGIIHCNIDPSHIMIRPQDHNLWLIDWSYSAVNSEATQDGFKVVNEDYSGPEVKERALPIPSSDLYSVGKCMIYLLGGNVKDNSMPRVVEDKFQRFIRFFVMKSRFQRAQDAWEMYEELAKLRTELWGKKEFLEFKL